MRKSCMILLWLAAVGCWAQNDSTQNTLNVEFNYLTHGEACGGGLPNGAKEDNSKFLLGRLRLNIDYNRPGLQAHAVVQNKAVWGMSGNKSLNLYEGWVKMTAKNGLFAQVGRVALAYDDERIIGANDFATAALSHDVLRVGYEGHGHKAHVILGYNQNGDDVYSDTYYMDGAQYYKTMQTVWYHYDVPKFPLGVSLLFMNMGLQAGYEKGDSRYDREPAHTVDQRYWGGYVKFTPGMFTVEGSFYKQDGYLVYNNENGYDGKIKVDAWMASASATVNPSDRYGFNLSFDYLSGDDYVPLKYHPTDMVMVHHTVMKGFSPLFGSRTKFYGIMDYFYESAYTSGFTPGLQKLSLGVIGKPTPKLDCSATYHYMATATKLSMLDRTLGHAVELQASYKFSDDISLTACYTQMSGTDTMGKLKQDNASKRARWGWFSLVVSPSLFKTKW